MIKFHWCMYPLTIIYLERKIEKSRLSKVNSTHFNINTDKNVRISVTAYVWLWQFNYHTCWKKWIHYCTTLAYVKIMYNVHHYNFMYEWSTILHTDAWICCIMSTFIEFFKREREYSSYSQSTTQLALEYHYYIVLWLWVYVHSYQKRLSIYKEHIYLFKSDDGVVFVLCKLFVCIQWVEKKLSFILNMLHISMYTTKKKE